MKNTVIKIENLSKQYRLGIVGTGTISHDLNRAWAKLRGKDDPYLKVGEINDRTKNSKSDYVWALKNINFEVHRGEVLGIIGRNGAGKSTLLKILSQITRPTTGSIKMKGRVGSLLEVGTGFHHELTGRENIYINGAILGMRKWEIDKKLDEIISFAGVEKYIDTPIKRYSSGMMVRLGFSVASHLDPEILIVDEVLAVGDAEFQKKCLEKMGDISKNQGRTILFVSHNLGNIREIANRGIVLSNGEMTFTGSMTEAISNYFSETSVRAGGEYHFNLGKFYNFNLKNIKIGESFKVEFDLELFRRLKNVQISLGISSIDGGPVHTTWHPVDEISGIKRIVFELKDIFLSAGRYQINVGILESGETIGYFDRVLGFEVLQEVSCQTHLETKRLRDLDNGFFLNPMNCDIKEIVE